MLSGDRFYSCCDTYSRGTQSQKTTITTSCDNYSQERIELLYVHMQLEKNCYMDIWDCESMYMYIQHADKVVINQWLHGDIY